MVFIIVLIAGPMLLFSDVNPVGQANPVSKGDLQFNIELGDSAQGTNLTVGLFLTTALTKNQTLTGLQYDQMHFNDPTSQSYQFYPSQTQAIQFSPMSDNVWGITAPKKLLLLQALNQTMSDPDSNNTVRAVIQQQFQRSTAVSATAIYKNSFDLTYENQTTLAQLIDAISCKSNQSNPILFPDEINSVIILNQKSQALKSNQYPPIYSGFTLNFQCSNDSSQDYWLLYQNFSSTSSLYNTTVEIFE